MRALALAALALVACSRSHDAPAPDNWITLSFVNVGSDARVFDADIGYGPELPVEAPTLPHARSVRVLGVVPVFGTYSTDGSADRDALAAHCAIHARWAHVRTEPIAAHATGETGAIVPAGGTIECVVLRPESAERFEVGEWSVRELP